MPDNCYKVGHTDVFCNQGSLVRLCIQDCKSLSNKCAQSNLGTGRVAAGRPGRGRCSTAP